MAALGTAVNLLDLSTRMDQDGNINGAAIAELLSQTNSFNGNMVWKEGNLTTGERVTIRTGLPTIYFRKLNQGVQPSKSTTVQVDEGTCMMEARGQIDKDLADLNGLTAAFRMSENQPFMEAMGQTFGAKAFYGNTGLDPEQFTGIATRYSSDSASVANSENIISGGGVGTDNTSIWLIDHSEQGCYGIYPKGLTAGLTHEDLGLGDAFDTQTPPARFRAYMDLWQWKCGLVVKDWRRVVRAANIDVSNLIAETSAADILELMAVMVDKIPAGGSNNLRFYCNRTVKTMLRIQCMNRPNVYLTLGQEEGRPKLSFDGIPIELHDQILSTESAVT
jgi:hypothetical protein